MAEKVSIDTNGLPVGEIPYDWFPYRDKECKSCFVVQPVEQYSKMLKNGRCYLHAYCRSCKNIMNSHYTSARVVIRHSPIPTRCVTCKANCSPINHYADWVEMECTHGHLWYHPRETQFKRPGRVVSLNT